MHIQIVTLHLKDLSDGDYRAACDGLAPVFAEVPGLVSKVWLADPATNTYGGVYTWVDRAAMQAFAGSELFASIVANPNLVDFSSSDFDVLDGPTRVTSTRVAAAA